MKDSSKATIVLLMILFSSFQIKAQNYIDSLSYYFIKKDNINAIRIAKNGIKNYETKRDTNNLDYAYCLFYSAELQKEDPRASDYYIKSISLFKTFLKEDNFEYPVYLHSAGTFFLFNAKNFDKAEYYLKDAEKLRKNIYGEKNIDYANSIYLLGFTYYQMREYEKALPLYLKTVEIRRELLGENDNQYLASMSSLALVYDYLNMFSSAEKVYSEICEITKKKDGEFNINYSISLDNLANLYYSQKLYLKSEPLYLKSLEIKRRILGENHLDSAFLLNNLGTIYQSKGEYEKAQKYFKSSIEIKKSILGDNDPSYLATLNNLGLLSLEMGDLQKAETLFLEVLEEKKTNKYNSGYANTLTNLGRVYAEESKIAKAEKILLEANEISKSVFGENHLKYATSLSNLASFYQDIGDYKKAEKYYNQTLIIEKKILGVDNPEYATTLNNLGNIYQDKGDYINAELFYLESIDIKRKVVGGDNPIYLTSLSNLAKNYILQKKYEKAEALMLEVLQKREIKLGKNHPDCIISNANLGCFYLKKGDYAKAEKYLLEAEKNNENKLDISEQSYLGIQESLAFLYFNWNKPNLAFKYFEKSFIPFQKQIIDASSFLSEKQMRFYQLDKFSNRFSSLTFLNHYPTQYENINIGCYQNELLVKNLSLRNQQRISSSIQKSGDAALQDKYEQFISNKRQLTKMSVLSADKRPENYEQLRNETETLEKELVRQSAAFSYVKNNLEVNWKQVQEKLKPNEVAIDLVAFKYFNYYKKWTDSIVYAAFVVKKGFKYPKYIPLFEQKQLEFLLSKSKNQQDNIRIDKQYTDKAISDLFLAPLTKELQGVTAVYLSPAGLGNQIDFSALPVSVAQTFGEKYQVHILGSTAELVNYKVAGLDKNTHLELLLYGGIDYDKSTPSDKINEPQPGKTDLADIMDLRTRSGITRFNYLPGTNDEVKQIEFKGKQNGFATAIIDENLATEESIKKLDGRTTPYVLHLATHGFFFPNPKQELPKDDFVAESRAKIYKISDDPMMRSGLLFAGANKFWGKPAENLTADDGILTASEISNLDLSACQLVVLSACDTGLGEIQGSEGVFGLQRAFKIAGVKNIIMSLWKVPDVQTAELFDIFYSECFSGKSIHEAFQIAQSKMKAKYSPYYWAGFVLLE